MTNDQIRSDVAELTERLRQIRIEQGLPPEPPEFEKSVGIPLSLALVKRAEPFITIAAKYAGILAQGQVTRIDPAKLTEFTDIMRVLNHSESFGCRLFSTGMRAAMQVMRHANDAIDSGRPGDYDTNAGMRTMHFAIGLMTRDNTINDDRYDYFRDHGEYPAEMEEPELQAQMAAVLEKGDDV